MEKGVAASSAADKSVLLEMETKLLLDEIVVTLGWERYL
jgi:hypothetical protein